MYRKIKTPEITKETSEDMLLAEKAEKKILQLWEKGTVNTNDILNVFQSIGRLCITKEMAKAHLLDFLKDLGSDENY